MSDRWKWVAVILAIELFVGVIDAKSVYRCHSEFGSECWPWFGIFAINLPASVLAASLLRATYSLSFYPQWMLSFTVYVAIGTIWWALVVHCCFWAIVKVKGKLRQKNA